MNHHRRLALLAVTIFAALAAPTGSAFADETDLLYDSGDLSSGSLPDYDPATYTSGAYIAAEQPDYSPGHIVDIGGGGWAPGETVTLVFHPDPQVRADTTMTATADEDGYFMHSEYQLEDIDLGTTYTVIATGETSGQSATTTFTDSATDFYFAYGSGNWNTSTAVGVSNPVWRTCTTAAQVVCTTDGVTAPTNAANVITIQTGVTVTVTAAVTVDQVVVAAGGQITVNSGVTMSLANGSGTDLNISGTVQDNGTIAEGSLGSTVVQSGGALNVAGSFTGTGGSGSTRAVLTENAGATMSVTGTISGGLFNVALNGAGSVSGSGAISVNNNSDIAVGGNWSVATTAGMSLGGGTSSGFTVDGTLSLTGTATIHLTGGAAASNPMTIQNNGVLKMAPGTLITSSVGGPFNLAAGSFMEIGATDGIAASGATGHIRTAGTRTFAQGANYTYNGTAPQVTGTGLPSSINEIFKIDNTAGVTLSGARAMASSATLNLANGDLATGANLLTMNGSAICAGTGDVVSTVGGGVKRTAFTSGGPTRCFGNPNNTIKIDSGSAPTDITMKLVKSVPTSPAFATAVARTYSITPNGGSPNATLSLHYNDGDLNGNTENALELWRVTSGAWVNQGRTGSVDTVNNAVTLSGVTQFSDWTLASTATKQDQTITFDQPADATYGDPDFDPGATSDSGLTVSYTSNSTGVCTIVSGQIHIVGVGTCSVTASQDGNDDYNAATPVPQTFDVDPAELSVDADDDSKEYGEADPSPLGYSLSGFVNGEDEDSAGVTGDASCSIDGAAGPGVGVYTDAITCAPGTLAAANYTFVTGDLGDFEIEPAPLTATVSDESMTYGGSVPQFSATFATFKGSDDDSVVNGTLSCDSTDGHDVAGSPHPVDCSGLSADNYEISYAGGSLDVDPAELSVDADDDSKEYGEADPSPLGYSLSGFVNGEDEDSAGVTGDASCSIDGAAGPGVGVYTDAITCAPGTLAAANYTFVTGDLGDFEIEPAPLTATVSDESMTYGGSVPQFSATFATFKGSDDDSVVNGTLSCDSTDGHDVAGSPHPVDCSGLSADNYEISYAGGSLDVDPAELSVDADDDSKEYGEADPSPLGYSLSGFVNGEDEDSAGVTGDASCSIDGAAGPGVGVYTDAITCAPGTLAAANYTFVTGDLGDFEIEPAPLTATVSDESMTYGGSVPQFSATFATFKGSDDDSVVNGTLSCDSTDGHDVAGSPHPVDCSGLSADNYEISYAGGSLDVDPAELSVDADDDSKEYGEADPSPLGYSLSGFVNGEDEDSAGVTGDASCSIDGAAGPGVGVYTDAITCAPGTLAAANYTFVTGDLGDFEIEPAPLTATVSDESMTYGGSVPQFSATFATFKGSDDDSVVNGTLSCDSTDGHDVAGSPHPVDCSGLSADNYEISYAGGSLDVDPAELAVNADNQSKEFNGPDPSPLTYKLSGFVNGEDKNSANVTGDADCVLDPSNSPNAANYPNVGTYPDAIICDPDDLAASNYTFATGALGTLTVTVANTTITYSGDTSKQYSDKAHLKATLTSGGNPLQGMTVTFRLGSQDFVQDTTDANGVAELDLKVDQAPATTFVVARFAGTNNYTQSSTGNQTFTVTQEDARATYTGFWDVATSSPSSSTATVTLSATIQDITDVTPVADPEAGDIRKAKVDFVDRDTNATLCNDLPVGLVTPGNTKVGAATCNWNANIGSADAKAYTIGIRVEGWYTRNDSAENAVVNVYKPLTTAFITGGGFLVNQSSAGSYYGDPGKRTNFGFNVKYNKAGTNLQGAINAIIRKGAYTYQVKGNAMTSLTSKLTSSPKTATFAGKANIQDITNPLQAQAIDGNATLQVTMSDYGTPGSSDKIGITVLNKSGGVWFASAWSGTKTLEQLLSGGNLTVR